MSRAHRNVAVVCAYDAETQKIAEDIVPLLSYHNGGSILLNSAYVRKAKGVRFVSVRLFDDAGNRIENFGKWYALDGREVEGFHRRPDGMIIE